jgi:hypothetical protein
VGTTNVNITLPLKDSVAHDIMHLLETMVTGTTTIASAIDNQTSSVNLVEVTDVAVGSLIRFPDTGELCVIAALPTTPGGPCLVTRGTSGDTAVDNFPEAAAAAHAAGATVNILKYKGLADMGIQSALSIMQQDIQQMGANSQTIGTYLQQQSTATQGLQTALNNLIND